MMTATEQSSSTESGAIQVHLRPIFESLGLYLEDLNLPENEEVWGIATHIDFETSILLPLMLMVPSIRRLNHISHDCHYLFVPAGLPRAEDLPWIPPHHLRADILEKKYGILGVDGWGGRLDQHALLENLAGSKVSSIEITAGEAAREKDIWVLPILKVVDAQDTRGEAVAKRGETDNWKRIIVGLRGLFEQGNLDIRRLWRTCFLTAISLEKQSVELLTAAADRGEDVEEAAKTLDLREFSAFTKEKLLRGAGIHLRGLGWSDENVAEELRLYEETMDMGLEEQVRQRALAKHDMRSAYKQCWGWMNLRCMKGVASQEECPEPVRRFVVYVTGESESIVFGSQARYEMKRRYEGPDCAWDDIEVIVDQGHPDGRYNISSSRAILSEVAKVFRVNEVRACGGELLPTHPIDIAGEWRFRTGMGREVIGDFLTHFLKSVGTSFHTNRTGISVGRTDWKHRRRLVRRTLEGLPPEQSRLYFCNQPGPICDRDCPFFEHQLAGCRDFRERTTH